jgi:hypothetical protein
MRAFSGFVRQKTVPINLYDLFPYASLIIDSSCGEICGMNIRKEKK